MVNGVNGVNAVNAVNGVNGPRKQAQPFTPVHLEGPGG